MFFCLGVLKYVVCLCKGCDGCCVFVCIVTRGAVSARVWPAVQHGKYECFVMQMLYVCVYPVAVLNAEFCMTCSLLMLVEDARGDHMEEAYSRAGLMTALYIVLFCPCKNCM